MKKRFWNLAKFIWMAMVVGGYIFYFTGTYNATQIIVWEVGLSLSLTAVYSFLSTYRLGPRKGKYEFNPSTDIAEMNPNQWLYITWAVQSVAIIIPAYSFSLVCAIVLVALLAVALLVTCSIMAILGRKCCNLIANGLMDY